MVVKPETIHRVHNILIVHFGVGYEIAYAVNHAMASPCSIIEQLSDWAWDNELEHGLTCDYEMLIGKGLSFGSIPTQMTAVFNRDDETQLHIHFQDPSCRVDLEWKNAKDIYILKYGKGVNGTWGTIDLFLDNTDVFEWLDFIMERLTNV